MAMLADGLQVGLIVGAARSLVGDVVNLVCRRGDTLSKTDLAKIAISLEDALSQLAPCPVISTVFRLSLRHLPPSISQVSMIFAVSVSLGCQPIACALSAYLWCPGWHTTSRSIGYRAPIGNRRWYLPWQRTRPMPAQCRQCWSSGPCWPVGLMPEARTELPSDSHL